MPDPSTRSQRNPIPIDVPTWLAAAVEPWRIVQAWLWHSGGLALDLRSERARVPVLVELSGSGLRVAIRERGVSAQRGAAFGVALARALEREGRGRNVLTRLAALHERLGESGDDEKMERVLAVWRSGEAGELPRGVRAAMLLHRLADGEVLATLGEWAALEEPGSTPSLPLRFAPAQSPGPSQRSFVEQHLDAIALGLIGRRDEALDALARAQGATLDAESWLAIARAYEQLDARESAIAAHEQVLARRGDAWDHLRSARAGRVIALADIPRLAPSASTRERVTFVRSLVKLFEATGRYDDALAAITSLLDDDGGVAEPPSDLLLRAATLHLWRCEGEQARRRLATLREDPQAKLIEGALACLEGRHQAALDLFATIESDASTRAERLLWQAEAEFALGNPESALARVGENIRLENSLAVDLIMFWILAATRPVAEMAKSIASRTFLDAMVSDVLPSMVDADRLARAHQNPREFVPVLRELLDAMGGNRSAKPTWLRRDDAQSSQRRLERIEVPPTGRDAAVENLVRVRTEPPERVLAGFDAVAAAFPRSPHPYTYRGELQIWLGRYDDALASFAEADERALTRWSYVGRAAAYDLCGASEQADHWTREGATRFGELDSATTHVYRGERLRKVGALEEARRDLEIAVGSKTRRVGARMNLALVYRALGDEAAWQRECERLRADAPAILWEVGVRTDRAIEVEDLHAALDAMVGNRSSYLHSIVDAHGRFRVLPDPGRWVAHARLCSEVAMGELERALVAAWIA